MDSTGLNCSYFTLKDPRRDENKQTNFKNKGKNYSSNDLQVTGLRKGLQVVLIVK